MIKSHLFEGAFFASASSVADGWRMRNVNPNCKWLDGEPITVGDLRTECVLQGEVVGVV